MAISDIKKKQDKAATLRKKIRDERAARTAVVTSASAGHGEAQLDQELVRLEAELAAEQALTKATKSAAKAAPTVDTTTAVAAAESAKAVAQQVAEGTTQKKES